MNRRKALMTLCGTVIAGLSGCTGVFDEDDVEIVDAAVSNMTDEKRTVETRIAYNGELVEESSHTVGESETVELECRWPSDPGEFVVRGRLEEDNEWVETELSDFDTGCASVVFNVNSGGHFHILTGDDCDPPGTTC